MRFSFQALLLLLATRTTTLAVDGIQEDETIRARELAIEEDDTPTPTWYPTATHEPTSHEPTSLIPTIFETPSPTNEPSLSLEPTETCLGTHDDLVAMALEAFGPGNCSYRGARPWPPWETIPEGLTILDCRLNQMASCIWNGWFIYYFVPAGVEAAARPSSLRLYQHKFCYEECTVPGTPEDPNPYYRPYGPAACEFMEENNIDNLNTEDYPFRGDNPCVFRVNEWRGNPVKVEDFLSVVSTMRSMFIQTDSPTPVPSGSPTADCSINPDPFEIGRTKNNKPKTTSCKKIAKKPHAKLLQKCQNPVIAENCPGLCDRELCPCVDYNLDDKCHDLEGFTKKKQERKCQKKPENSHLCPSVCDFRCSTAEPTMAPNTPAPVPPTYIPFDDGCDD